MPNNIAQWFKLKFRTGSDESALIWTKSREDPRPRLRPTEEPIPPRSDIHPTATALGFRLDEVMSRVLSSRHHDLLAALSPTPQSAVLLAMRAALETIETCRERGTSLDNHLKSRASTLRQTHQLAVSELLRSNAHLETQIRALAWALDADWAGGPTVRLVENLDIERNQWEPFLLEAAHRTSVDPLVVVWLSEDPLPSALVEAARRRCLLIVADHETCRTNPLPGALLVDVNPGWIRRPASDGTLPDMRISGVAGRAQAMLGTAPPSAWKVIRPPTFFSHLQYDIRASEEADLLGVGFVSAIPSGGSRGEIVISARSLPKRRGIDR